MDHQGSSPDRTDDRPLLENAQRALLNILDDFAGEKSGLEFGQRAVLNILEDFEAEKAHMEGAQRAVLNILGDFALEKTQLESAQRAVLNILDDFTEEKDRLETMQRAVLNILEDFDAEKVKVEAANQQLARQIQERERAEHEIRRVNTELVASNKELEAFTYSVSHDLRAPLRHIAGFANIVLDDYGARLEPEAQSYLQRVIAGTRQMGDLVDDLLKLSRLGRQELTRGSRDLQGLAHAAVSDFRAEAEAAGRRIDWRVDELPTTACDAGLMKQVFSNLLANAVKFTRTRERAVIEVGSTTKDGRMAIFVRDNGVGFSMKYADKLFGVFQRLHRVEDFEGTGIGLATVQRIIHKHGGQIWVEAEPDRGATFYFTLGTSPEVEAENLTARGA